MMRIHPVISALATLAVLERQELVELPHKDNEQKATPTSPRREDYPSRQAWRAATKPWRTTKGPTP